MVRLHTPERVAELRGFGRDPDGRAGEQHAFGERADVVAATGAVVIAGADDAAAITEQRPSRIALTVAPLARLDTQIRPMGAARQDSRSAKMSEADMVWWYFRRSQ